MHTAFLIVLFGLGMVVVSIVYDFFDRKEIRRLEKEQKEALKLFSAPESPDGDPDPGTRPV
jgi:hypothetical protein